jgi:hypothetical protein
MDITSKILCESVVMGVMGGFVLDIMNFIEFANTPKDRRPDLDMIYWLAFLAWPLLGGFLVYLYNGEPTQLTRVVAFQIGMSSPLILKAMVTTIPKQTPKLPPGA